VIERWSVVGFERGSEPQASRALPALTREAWAQRLRRRLDSERFAGGFALVTCERAELVRVTHTACGVPPDADHGEEARLLDEATRFFAGDSAAGATLRAALRVRRGRAAVRHLLRIPAGLDSRLIGEEEIAGQWRGALDAARRERTLGDDIERLARWEARSTRRARLALATETGSLAARALRAASEALRESDDDDDGREPRFAGIRVGIVGTGEMAHDLARGLREAGAADLLFYGRHAERTATVSRRFGGRWRDREGLREDLAHLDVLLLATRSRQPVLDVADVSERRRPLIAIDLGEPALLGDRHSTSPGGSPSRNQAVRRIDLAQLSAAGADSGRLPASERAERIIDEEVDRWLERRVVLAAHGEGDGSAINRRVADLALRVEAHAAVPTEAAFRLGSPSWSRLASNPPGEVVPVLAAQGHFHREVLTRAFADTRVIVHPPIGEHALVRRGVVERVRREVVRFSARGGPVAILVAAHGTERHAGSGSAAGARSRALARHFRHVAVATGYLDQTPTIEDAVRELVRRDPRATLLVVPWFLGGAHVREDLPRRVQQALAEPDSPTGSSAPRANEVVFLAPLLDEPALLPAILARVGGRPASRAAPLRLGSRGSALALSQAETVRRLLGERGVAARVVVIDTAGDRERERPIDDFPTAGPFTDDLENALRQGRIDVAVHSLKDLPLTADDDPELRLAAFLERGPAADVLVLRPSDPSAGGPTAEPILTLDELARGARVGTCSDRRRLQLLEARPDLVALPIRGTIERRVAQLDGGRYDALILAEAAFVRLGWTERVTSRLPLGRFVPEPGQAVVALQVRRDESVAVERADLAALDHPPTASAALVERELARRFAGGSTGPDGCLAAHADFDFGALRLRSRWFPGDGLRGIDATLRRPIEPALRGADVARRAADAAERELRRRRSEALEALEASESRRMVDARKGAA
jgi:hydroxymethylbilane synthase